MDADELFPKQAPRPTNDTLTALARQDLDPLSVDELDARVAALETEIVRTKTRRAAAVNHRATADALFR